MKHVHILRPSGAVISFVHDFLPIFSPLWGFSGIYKGPEGRNIVRTGNKKISKAPEERNMRYAWF
jgi:hypothetical protein